jgi:phytoene synthase
VYGSAEVIGLMMSRIMGLPKEAYSAAKYQGRAMQWINFIRDIQEDNELGRCYFPQDELKKYGLKNLSKTSAEQDPEAFKDFMLFQIARYDEWQSKAREGFEYIPKRLLAPLKTAVDMYDWTARQIAVEPMIVFDKKVKPSKQQVMKAAARNTLRG